MPSLIRLDPADTAATARSSLAAGEEGAGQAIPRGHKMAPADIAKGEPVCKYAQVSAMPRKTSRRARTSKPTTSRSETSPRTSNFRPTCARPHRRNRRASWATGAPTGAAAKGGTTPRIGVFKYAEPIRTRGFVFMDSRGYDPASVTGQIASGCNLIAFTTGRGSAFGSKPAPTIKIVTNSERYERMAEDMDVNADRILTERANVEDVGQEIYQRLLDVATGTASKSEAQGLGDNEFVPWQIGAVK